MPGRLMSDTPMKKKKMGGDPEKKSMHDKDKMSDKDKKDKPFKK